jgi:hypothetical protein
MDNASRHSSSYLVSFWVDQSADGVTLWRGVLVTAAGQRLHFSTLTQLNQWLSELVGWQDPPQAGKTELPR